MKWRFGLLYCRPTPLPVLAVSASPTVSGSVPILSTRFPHALGKVYVAGIVADHVSLWLLQTALRFSFGSVATVVSPCPFVAFEPVCARVFFLFVPRQYEDESVVPAVVR